MLGGVLIASGLGVFVIYSSRKHASNTAVVPKQEQQPGTPTTATNTTPSTTPSTATTNPSSNESSAGTASASSTLPAPTGQIVNVDQISLSADIKSSTSPALISTCQTIVGASCTLKISGAQTYTIQPTSSDGNGQFSFEWNAKTVGLTPGSWNVQAIASKGGQTSSSGIEVLHVSS